MPEVLAARSAGIRYAAGRCRNHSEALIVLQFHVQTLKRNRDRPLHSAFYNFLRQTLVQLDIDADFVSVSEFDIWHPLVKLRGDFFCTGLFWHIILSVWVNFRLLARDLNLNTERTIDLDHD
jgi:hypothetical protein